MSSPNTASLVEQGIAACRAGDKVRAFDLLVQALRRDARSENAWLWLSAVVGSKAEQRFCLERVLEINPQHAAVRQGLQKFSAAIVAQAPFSLDRAPKPAPSPIVQAAPPYQVAALTGSLINISVIAEQLGISQQQVNLLFAELGWLERDDDGWQPTERGLALGAMRRVYPMSGVVFTIWPDSVVRHKAVIRSSQSTADEATNDSFRDRFPDRHRTTDGHWVRSKAEVLIDNWLYLSGIVHAYERPLPIDEDAYCNFYIPQGNVYIDYWGLADDAADQDRRRKKQRLYQRHRFNLIELTDEHVHSLDDVLPKLLLKFGVNIA